MVWRWRCTPCRTPACSDHSRWLCRCSCVGDLWRQPPTPCARPPPRCCSRLQIQHRWHSWQWGGRSWEDRELRGRVGEEEKLRWGWKMRSRGQSFESLSDLIGYAQKFKVKGFHAAAAFKEHRDKDRHTCICLLSDGLYHLELYLPVRTCSVGLWELLQASSWATTVTL